jgi:hypothetical protein
VDCTLQPPGFAGGYQYTGPTGRTLNHHRTCHCEERSDERHCERSEATPVLIANEVKQDVIAKDEVLKQPPSLRTQRSNLRDRQKSLIDIRLFNSRIPIFPYSPPAPPPAPSPKWGGGGVDCTLQPPGFAGGYQYTGPTGRTLISHGF